MAERPQFQLMSPQILPVYGSQPSPTTFPMLGQPIFQTPPNFCYPSIAWPPVPQFPPPSPSPQVTYNPSEEDDDCSLLQQHFAYSDNDNLILNEQQQWPRRMIRSKNPKHITKKFDTRYEEFRKYLEEMGVLSVFSNIFSEIYQNPLRPKDPLKHVQDRFQCSQPDAVELSNLRLWCDQYQARTVRLEKELKHVIERLRKYEPYNTDESLFDDTSSENECKSCVLDTVNLEHKLENNEESTNYVSV